MSKRYKKMYWSYKKEIELEVAKFLAFHEYNEVHKPEFKNDGCLDDLVKLIVRITKHPDKYKFIEVSTVRGNEI